jgi:AAA+ ATPase superfamily predicted ATPase
MAKTKEKVKQLDLVGTFEAHLILGVERSRLARWLKENEKATNGSRAIGEPVARLRSGPVWFRAQIEEKLRELAAEAKVDKADLDKWAAARSLARARQVSPPVPVSELRVIIRRPV